MVKNLSEKVCNIKLGYYGFVTQDWYVASLLNNKYLNQGPIELIQAISHFSIRLKLYNHF